MQAGKAAAQGVLGKEVDHVVNPKQMVPSWTEAGARLLVARFINRSISIGNLMSVLASSPMLVMPHLIILISYLYSCLSDCSKMEAAC